MSSKSEVKETRCLCLRLHGKDAGAAMCVCVSVCLSRCGVNVRKSKFVARKRRNQRNSVAMRGEKNVQENE
jgi:hypothetical protein